MSDYIIGGISVLAIGFAIFKLTKRRPKDNLRDHIETYYSDDETTL